MSLHTCLKHKKCRRDSDSSGHFHFLRECKAARAFWFSTRSTAIREANVSYTKADCSASKKRTRCKSGRGDQQHIHVAQLDQSATLRRWRSQVQVLSWIPTRFTFWIYDLRAELDRSPEIAQDCGVTAASSPVKRTVRVQIPTS